MKSINDMNSSPSKQAKDSIENLNKEEGLALCLLEIASEISTLLPKIKDQRFKKLPLKKKVVEPVVETCINYLLLLGSEFDLQIFENMDEEAAMASLPLNLKNDSFMAVLYVLSEIDTLCDVIWVKTNGLPTSEEDVEEVSDCLDNMALGLKVLASQFNIEI